MDNLPVELIFELLSYLDVKEIKNCSQLNHYWYGVTNSDSVWKRFCTSGKRLKEYKHIKGNQGTLKPFCYWKWYYINYERIAYRWRQNLYAEYKVPSDADYDYYRMIEYDGKTLIIPCSNGFRVFKVHYGKVLDMQTVSVSASLLIFLSSICTNTSYIVLNCGKVLLVYKLARNAYECVSLLYKLYSSENLTQISNIAVDKMDREISTIAASFFSNEICTISSVVNSDILFINVNGKIVMWDLITMNCIKKIDACTFIIARDKFNIYICSDCHTINAYSNNNIQPFLSLEANWFVSQIKTNHEIIFAIETEGTDAEIPFCRKVCVWNKHTGKILYQVTMNLPDLNSIWLHPTSDFFLGMNSHWQKYHSISIKDNDYLWMHRVRMIHVSFCRKIFERCFPNFAADRFVVIPTSNGDTYGLMDFRAGQTLYEYKCEGKSEEILFVGFDVLLCMGPYKKEISIRLYS